MRSVSGTVASIDSCNTRSLNDNQLNSLLIIFMSQICTKVFKFHTKISLRMCKESPIALTIRSRSRSHSHSHSHSRSRSRSRSRSHSRSTLSFSLSFSTQQLNMPTNHLAFTLIQKTIRKSIRINPNRCGTFVHHISVPTDIWILT